MYRINHFYIPEYFGSYFLQNTDGEIDWEMDGLSEAYMSSKISVNANISIPIYSIHTFPDPLHKDTYPKNSVVFEAGLLYTGELATIT
ncbi:MAG: hypothetical protein LBB61_06260 [Treponema sp.]|jgi:hypothetical protein|nr:hypothetical protein [Treponema sp.]